MDLGLYRKRQSAYGGSTAIEKLDYRNKKMFYAALEEGFNSEDVIYKDSEWKALILDDKLTLEVDQKWVSMPLESGLRPGDVVHATRNGIRWIMVQEDLTERSFRRCVGKRCVTEVSWRDDNDIVHTSWAALRGPTETSIKTEARKHLLFDQGNEKLALWLPDTENTLGLRRYKYLMVEGEVWEIASVDYFTTPGILELNLVEAQDNKDLDNTSLGIARDRRFTFTNVFDNDLDFQLNEYISLEPCLMKDGIDITLIKDDDFVFICVPDTYIYDEVHEMVSFSAAGNYQISIGYPGMKLVKEYNIEVVQKDTTPESYYLIQGNSSIKPLVNSIESYDVKYFENGVEKPIVSGTWRYDSKYANKVKESMYYIDLNFNNGQVGKTVLEYIVDGKVVAEKDIIVHSLFG